MLSTIDLFPRTDNLATPRVVAANIINICEESLFGLTLGDFEEIFEAKKKRTNST